MKAHNYIITITVALLISVSSYAAEVPLNIGNNGSVSTKGLGNGSTGELGNGSTGELGNGSSGESGNDSSGESGNDSSGELGNDSSGELGNDSSGELGNGSSGESGNDSNLANFNEPISNSDIGGNEPIYFDDSVNNGNDNEEQLLSTPIPAAIWLFITGLLGFSSLEKRKKKI